MRALDPQVVLVKKWGPLPANINLLTYWCTDCTWCDRILGMLSACPISVGYAHSLLRPHAHLFYYPFAQNSFRTILVSA